MIIRHSDDEVYNRKLTKASTSLVIRLPFFGYVLFGTAVRVIADPTISTMATDGVNIYCGVNFAKNEPFEVVTFALLHELIHVYFNHVGRRGSRDPKTWNIAADIYVNGQCSELLGENVNGTFTLWKVPDEFIQWDPVFAGKTVEEIYELIKKQEEQKAGSMQGYLPKGKDGKPSDKEVSNGQDMVEPREAAKQYQAGADGDPQDSQDFQETFRQDISRAKSLADQSAFSKPLPSAVRSRMDKILRPTLPWGSLVRGHLSEALGWDEATYCPPKMKFYPIILPQTRTVKERKLLLGVDVSASVTQELIKIFISNVEAAAHRATEIIIVTFDAVNREVFRTKRPGDIYRFMKFVSGAHSHTSARGVFEIADKEKPSAICILTDGYIYLPDRPYKRTTFVIPEGGRVLPWGKTYVMEHPWR